MKKTCSGCRALDGNRCVLGFKIASVENPNFGWITLDYKPVEQCPKPTTYKKYIELYNKRTTQSVKT